MTDPSRMARYDIRNDGVGPYAVFYCDKCGREYRSQPNVGGTIARDIGQDITGGLLRKIPIFGGAVANSIDRNDPRYSYSLTPQQINDHWNQVKQYFRECPTCHQILCLSDFDEVSGYCNEDSPRGDQIAEARGQQAGAALKGIANVFGLGSAFEAAGKAAQQAINSTAHCPNCNAVAQPGTKFCPECGTLMIQPVSTVCPKCGTETKGAKFCPNCGAKQEAPAAAAPANCPKCGAPANGAKFCANCGTKIQ
jgi:hypothetical protein